MGSNLEKELGQMFVIRFQGQEINDELITLIKDYHIGGITLYKKNYDNYAQMLNIINELKKINHKYNDTPLFIAIDQEGGRVNRLPKEFKNIVAAKKLSIDKKYVEKGSNLISYALDSLGVNMNFAPVLDIQRFEDGHAIGDRCYGFDKESVSSKGLIMMKALKKKRIVSVVKHFPGHGLVKRDSHLFLPFIFKNIKESDDIVPFKEAINNGCDAIMISHIMIRKMDRLYPASLSKKVIKNYLVDELGFKGLIVTDDLKMKAVNLLYGYKRSTYKAIEAGNNIVLIGSSYRKVIDCINYIKKKMTEEVKKNIEESYQKIIKIKDKYEINDKINKPIDVDKYNQEVEELNKEVKDKIK